MTAVQLGRNLEVGSVTVVNIDAVSLYRHYFRNIDIYL